ncbi:hypothetical protein ACFQO8_04710 [Exiguobacterium aestuarii]|uniref:Uncharacterized protein n=1 Tax=Exiguobacterium aestuarii TaxID=273527 RepID=A0ABW2PM60_9BACL|nr:MULTISPECIES: hypothetical protein [Exiguobacterium]MCT4786455.1 hypothetical protein [Exiguobacterium aestuarii]
MIEKMIRHSWNVISGLFVLGLSLWLSGPGIAESDIPQYRWYFMLWFALWTIGFILQFRPRMKWIGLFITFIPTLYYLIDVLKATEVISY